MANIRAQATGNWSAGATWVGGVPPSTGDVGYANTFTVTIDQDITCTAISNRNNTAITGGGSFIISTGTRILNCDIHDTSTSSSGTAAPCLDITGAATVTINGAVRALASNGWIAVRVASGANSVNLTINGAVTGGNDSSFGLSVVGNTCTLAINGAVAASAGGNPGTSVTVSGTGCVATIVGNVTGGNGGSSSNGLTVSATATITITGALLGGTQGAAVALGSTGSTVTVTGNVTGDGSGSTNGAGIAGSGSAIVIVAGTVTAGTNAAAIDVSSTAAKVTVSGSCVSGTNNRNPIYARNFTVKAGQNIDWTIRDDSASPTGAVVHLTNYVTNSPAPTEVRSGTTYGPSSTLVGTLAVPPVASVLIGTPVNASVGTAALTVDKMLDPL